VSPSPLDTQATAAVRNYGNSWNAIMQLVRAGHSWSGHERNCVFLNCTSSVPGQAPGSSPDRLPQFSDISAMSGLDWPDDGRAVAVVDWDHDGDLDLWLRNRTAPRIRLMRNVTCDVNADAMFLNVRLIGSSCNRDAVGARAELVTSSGEADSIRTVRSVRAGDAFLSQSSKSLHFGLAKDSKIERLIVTWPGGEREEFSKIIAGQHLELRQGTGVATVVKPRIIEQLASGPVQPLAPTAAARIILPARIAWPPLEVTRQGKPLTLSADTIDTPTLITFWSSSCPNCRREITELGERLAEFERANLAVRLVCVDGADQSGETPSGIPLEAQEFLTQVKLQDNSASADAIALERLRQFQNALFSRYPSFVIPMSFLVDSQGQVICIYRGSFACETFLQDRALTDLVDTALRTLAPPLAGTWITQPATRTQFAEFIGERLTANLPDLAAAYYEAAAKAETDAARQHALQSHADALRRRSIKSPLDEN
jgi:thiol-disulfide isomerase/thioredoxin